MNDHEGLSWPRAWALALVVFSPALVEAKDAVKTALEFVEDLYGKGKLEGLLLEEVELSGDESYWLVTIGFNVGRPQPTNQPNQLMPFGGKTVEPVPVREPLRIYEENFFSRNWTAFGNNDVEGKS